MATDRGEAHIENDEIPAARETFEEEGAEKGDGVERDTSAEGDSHEIERGGEQRQQPWRGDIALIAERGVNQVTLTGKPVNGRGERDGRQSPRQRGN